ncbi:hypothetical protein B6D12_06205 [Gilliamella apicola]|uniref:hypothetical protein n=1 Tax=Gilliamella apicola TaxID=1196095 RepID=UPI000A358F45|nr:hypothetical protein [Gilliamella apicola]OTP90475.1 hypothetical protein B5S41_03565 [Gilliamella apicola]OTP93744.1 hypothetical protein B6D13_09040 [Gilliamella apicola]OTQ00711.1 hypothetical protein B6D07_09740 [Gilliamella apicola]OTQ05753.1 hypothetical protein B6D12_06205 [Gilliamella apicola]OTQ27474.1 hypothetical protein B6D02_08565 [Gilliamella apicola]
MKYLFFLIIFAFDVYADNLNCNAIYQENSLRGLIKSHQIVDIKKINDNHYDLNLKLSGSIQQKLDNFPTNRTHTLIDIKCVDTENEQKIKSMLKL